MFSEQMWPGLWYQYILCSIGLTGADFHSEPIGCTNHKTAQTIDLGIYEERERKNTLRKFTYLMDN